MKKKFRCLVCGYVYEGENPPAECPVCHAKSDKFVEIKDEEPMAWACEHVIGVAKGCDPEIHEGLEAHFTGECTEVSMYLAMSTRWPRMRPVTAPASSDSTTDSSRSNACHDIC